MAAVQLQKDNEEGKITSLTRLINDNTKVVAHAGDKWKPGYFTISRVQSGKNSWRNVHLSKTSFDKLASNVEEIVKALGERQTDFQLMLTKKQHVVITNFCREGKDTLVFASILHPNEDAMSITHDLELNHAKTINLSLAEVKKLQELLPECAKVVATRTIKTVEKESLTITAYRWRDIKTRQVVPVSLFPNLDECRKDAMKDYVRFYDKEAQPDAVNIEKHYEFEEVKIQRPSKLALIQEITCLAAVSKLVMRKYLLDKKPAPAEDIDEVVDNIDRDLICTLLREIMCMLKYRNTFISLELVDIFFFTNGVERVKQDLLTRHEHFITRDIPLHQKLINRCFANVPAGMDHPFFAITMDTD
jgi:hypothetical protein